jgi:hypothetical protein
MSGSHHDVGVSVPDGDGIFELASSWSYYEGGGVSVFSLGDVPEEILLAGCGL